MFADFECKWKKPEPKPEPTPNKNDTSDPCGGRCAADGCCGGAFVEINTMCTTTGMNCNVASDAEEYMCLSEWNPETHAEFVCIGAVKLAASILGSIAIMAIDLF